MNKDLHQVLNRSEDKGSYCNQRQKDVTGTAMRLPVSLIKSRSDFAHKTVDFSCG